MAKFDFGVNWSRSTERHSKTNFVEIDSLMLHDKFHDHRIFGSESAVFIFQMMYFQTIPLSDYFVTTISVVVPCGGLNIIPVHRLSVVLFTFSVPSGL